jgi:hypothetical protein
VLLDPRCGAALSSLAFFVLSPGDRFFFYVYPTREPIREFSDYIRHVLREMVPEDAWKAL